MIVEIDGSRHINQQAYDTRRDEFFKSHGYEVMRFPANLPFSDLQSIVEAIYSRVNELAALAPIPAFPQRGKEQEKSASLLLPLGEESALLLPPLGEGRDGGSPLSKFSI